MLHTEDLVDSQSSRTVFHEAITVSNAMLRRPQLGLDKYKVKFLIKILITFYLVKSKLKRLHLKFSMQLSVLEGKVKLQILAKSGVIS